MIRYVMLFLVLCVSSEAWKVAPSSKKKIAKHNFQTLLQVAVSQSGCGINEYLTTNVNPCNRCDIKGWCPQRVPLPVCDCIPYHFRNSRGICVPPEACDNIPRQDGSLFSAGDVRPPPRCTGPAEEYRACGSACPPTCEDRNSYNRNVACPAVCVDGCFCRAGYLRNRQGVCVRPKHCDRVVQVVVSQSGCGINEYLVSSVNPCNRCDIKGWCPQRVPIPVCDCMPVHFRNSRGICVPPEACDNIPSQDVTSVDPNVCGRNEEFLSCGSACPPSCDNLGTDVFCIQLCVVGCFCIKGYVRKGGECVKESECGTQPVIPRSIFAPFPYGLPAKPYPSVPVVKPPPKVPQQVQPYTPSPSPPPPSTPHHHQEIPKDAQTATNATETVN